MALSKDEAMKMAGDFIKLIRKKHDVREAYLFGSFATGTANDYSDIDLALVLGTLAGSEDSPFDEDFYIFHEAQKYNSLLEVVCFLQHDFDRGATALAKKIKKEGVKLMECF